LIHPFNNEDLRTNVITGIYFKTVFTPQGWEYDVSADIAADGTFSSLTQDNNPHDYPVVHFPVVPGIENIHSHAFQHAMAGLTEVQKNPVDNFWSWREMMYYFVNRISPEDMAAIASKLYLDFLKGGYTGVVEFHYVHNDPAGRRYDAPEELSLAILEAANATGIQLTHLPVYYAYSDFGGRPPNDGQRRFITSIDDYAHLVEALAGPCDKAGHVLGVAPHSLRAAAEDDLARLLDIRDQFAPLGPIHIHVAEQTKEVEDSIAFSGRRPVERLADLVNLDPRWCLVHATHMTDDEAAMVARSGATVGLCPLTEANLGDGFFNAPAYFDHGGHVGIGSDSNVSTNVWAELQMLEYSQRLVRRQRNVLVSEKFPNVGNALHTLAGIGGARAAARKSGQIAPGYLANFVELSKETSAEMDRLPRNAILDHWVFATERRTVGDVYIAGRKVLDCGHHRDEERIVANFHAAIGRLSLDL